MAMLKPIRTLLVIAAHHDYKIWQINVKITFLNGYLDKQNYMEQPLDFTSSDKNHKVCKLQRFLYRLKQVSQIWNMHFNHTIKSFDFIRNEEKPCIYKINGSVVTFLILYMDDVLLIGNNIPILILIKMWLSRKFFMKDLEKASYILKIKVHREI